MPKEFSIETLAQTLEQHVPGIDFALLFGSAKTGSVKASSDIDIGVFLNVPATPEIILSIASETIRAGLRLLEEKKLKLDILRQFLNEGENSGFVHYSFDNLIVELDRESAD